MKIAAGRPDEALVLLAEALELRLAEVKAGEAVTRAHMVDCHLGHGGRDQRVHTCGRRSPSWRNSAIRRRRT